MPTGYEPQNFIWTGHMIHVEPIWTGHTIHVDSVYPFKVDYFQTAIPPVKESVVTISRSHDNAKMVYTFMVLGYGPEDLKITFSGWVLMVESTTDEQLRKEYRFTQEELQTLDLSSATAECKHGVLRVVVPIIVPGCTVINIPVT